MSEELATLDEGHEEVDSEIVLEDVLHVYQEGVVDSIQDIFLELDIFHLLVLKDDILADALHGEELLGAGLLDQEHLPEGTLANHLEQLEVIQLRIVVVTGELLLCTLGHVLLYDVVHVVETIVFCVLKVVVSLGLSVEVHSVEVGLVVIRGA